MRAMLRDVLVYFMAIPTAPLWLLARLEEALTGGEGCFTACSELLSLFPGKLGVFVRRGFYRMTLDKLATDCSLGFGTTIAHRQVCIGRGVYVGNRCTIGRVAIEEDVTIGSNVDMLSGRHQHHFARLDQPIQQQGGSFAQLRIGRNSWIGNSSVVMADIGSDCVIGAGSVVVKEIPAGAIAAGNPAVVKKWRTPSEEAA